MPKSSLQRREFGAKKPYLIATMGCLVAILLAFGFFYNKIAALKAEALDKLKAQLTPLSSQQSNLEREMRRLSVAENEGKSTRVVARKPRVLGESFDGVAPCAA
jgi:predicted transcriptional regulator